MDFTIESLSKYHYNQEELITHISEQFKFLLGVVVKSKTSELINPELSQKTYYLACVLWQSQETTCDLTNVLTRPIYEALLDWTFKPRKNEYLFVKHAIDRILCSMYTIRPDLYDELLVKLQILHGSTNLYSGRDTEYKFCHIVPNPEDLTELSRLNDLKNINVTENMLKSLGTISLSYTLSYKLINSGFLSMLIDVVIDFLVKDKSTFHERTTTAGASSTNAIAEPLQISMSLVATVLNFFAELSWQTFIKTWFSSEMNSILWDHLLRYLCFKVPISQKGSQFLLISKPKPQSLQKLEEAAINFFTKCCCGYPENQKKLARTFGNVLMTATEPDNKLPGISEFMRRVLIELIISPGYMYVSVETDLQQGINTTKTTDVSLLMPPPAFPTSKRHQLLYLNADRTCSNILNKVISCKNPTGNCKQNDDLNFRSILDVVPVLQSSTTQGDLTNDYVLFTSKSVEAGNSAPSTRKTLSNSLPSSSKRSIETEDYDHMYSKKNKLCDAMLHDQKLYKLMLWVPNMNQYVNINQSLTIAEILQIFAPTGDELEVPVLKFILSKREQVDVDEENFESNYFLPTPAIQTFIEMETFKYITLNIEMKKTNNTRKIKKGRTCTWNAISMHTLLAFGQFLRLPEYRSNPDIKAIRDSIQGLEKKINFCSEKYKRFFALNVTQLLNPLALLPFEFLRHNFSRNYKITQMIPDCRSTTAIDFVFMYLAMYTHQPNNIEYTSIQEHKVYMKAIQQCCSSRINNNNNNNNNNNTNINNNINNNSYTYWPKGTGYNSSDYRVSERTNQSSRVEETEELVTVLLLVIGEYINPHPNLRSSYMSYKEEICDMRYMHRLPSSAVRIIKKSCLLTVLMSYLTNDSIFDLVSHIALYKAIMLLLRTMVSNVQLMEMIVISHNENTQAFISSGTESRSIIILIRKLKAQTEEYLRLTRLDNGTVSSTSSIGNVDDGDKVLFQDICDTADIIETITRNAPVIQMPVPCNITSVVSLESQSGLAAAVANNTSQNEEPHYNYVQMLKKLQFDHYVIISETENGIKFDVPFHYKHLSSLITVPGRMKRLAMEMSSLASSLPISNESAIFVRHDESRIDILKALITGPAGTPYMNGCFEFDIFFPKNYPNEPMLVNFQTTGRGMAIFNPNLYNSGKVCLSLLNTWTGGIDEKWNPKTSNILQVLVSIQGMILVPEPYFNEPGWEVKRGTTQGNTASKAYNDNLLPMTIRYAMIEQIASPSPCFKEVIHKHFWLKKDEIKQQVTEWINQSNLYMKDKIQREANCLFKDLDKLTPPINYK